MTYDHKNIRKMEVSLEYIYIWSVESKIIPKSVKIPPIVVTYNTIRGRERYEKRKKEIGNVNNKLL